MEYRKIQSFTDLRVWQEAHRFVLLIYKITKAFPKEETFGLVSQMKRAAVSITSNIAEGFSWHSSKRKAAILFNCSWLINRVAKSNHSSQRCRVS